VTVAHLSATPHVVVSPAQIPDKNHFNPTDTSFEEIVDRIIAFQAARKSDPLKEMGQLLIIMDDLFVSSRRGVGVFSSGLSRLAATGRHYGIFCILIAQRYTSIGPSIRSQASHYLTFRPRSDKERSMLFDAYLSRENSGSRTEAKRKARDVLEDIFEGPDKAYRAMVIECESTSSKLEDSVFWIKAPSDEKPWTLPLIKMWDEGKEESNTGLASLQTLP